MWHWQSNLTPKDIADGKPDRPSWGLPSLNSDGGSCDFETIFYDHNVYINPLNQVFSAFEVILSPFELSGRNANLSFLTLRYITRVNIRSCLCSLKI